MGRYGGEAMWWCHGGTGVRNVGEVGDGFRGCAKEWGRFNPARGEGQGKGNECRLARGSREEDAKFGDVAGQQPDAVETIGNIHFGDVHRAEPGVGAEDFGKETVKRPTELERVMRGERYSVGVHVGESVVHDATGAAIALGNDAKGA